MDEISIAVGQSPNYLRDEVDKYILSNFPQYNNSIYLIKLLRYVNRINRLQK